MYVNDYDRFFVFWKKLFLKLNIICFFIDNLLKLILYFGVVRVVCVEKKIFFKLKFLNLFYRI